MAYVGVNQAYVHKRIPMSVEKFHRNITNETLFRWGLCHSEWISTIEVWLRVAAMEQLSHGPVVAAYRR